MNPDPDPSLNDQVRKMSLPTRLTLCGGPRLTHVSVLTLEETTGCPIKTRRTHLSSGEIVNVLCSPGAEQRTPARDGRGYCVITQECKQNEGRGGGLQAAMLVKTTVGRVRLLLYI